MILCATVHSWNQIFTTDVNLLNNCLNKIHGLELHPLHSFFSFGNLLATCWKNT